MNRVNRPTEINAASAFCAEVASALVASVPRAQRTLLVELISRSFVDAYFHIEESGDPEHIVTWVDRMCDAHPDTPAVRSFFSGACGALGRSLRGCDADLRSGTFLRTLDDSIRVVAAKPRRPLRRSAAQLDETDAAIHALIVRLERSDPLTAEHSRAVSAWCGRLARRLSLSEKDAVFAARCGMIHDIGKIATPPEILSAPRALTPEEWTKMREHTTAGELIVRDDATVSAFAPAVRSHHERLDGRGYPDALDARDLPLTTRIVTVADSFNAMIGRRPYRLPMSPATAIDQLVRHSGTQFDPAIVAAMRDIVR